MRSTAGQLSVALLLASLSPVLGQDEGPTLLDNRVVDVVTQTATDIWSVARELQVGAACVLASNPLSLILRPGDILTVPESCCGNSCEGSFCGGRAQCPPSTTSTSLTGILIPTTATSSTTGAGGIIVPPVPTTVNSNGETVILGITLPIGLRTITPVTLKDGSVITFTPEATTAPTTDQKTTDQKTTDQRTTDQKTTEQQTTDQKTTSTTTSTTSSSSSSCTSSTVTNLFLSCTPTGTTSSCTPTSSWLATGCSVTPTTVTCGILTPTGPIADPACNAERFNYVVYPNDGLDAGQMSALESLLAKYVATPGDLTSTSASGFGIIYWSIKLTKDQSAEVVKLEGVAAVNDNCIDKCPGKFTDGGYRSQKADQSWAFGQQTVFSQLPYVSWARNPDDPSKNDRSDTYVFDESAGLGVDVYMIDSGADTDHPEFDRVRVNTRWVPRNSPSAFRDLESHGTAVLGAITGQRAGVAKNVNVFVAPVEDGRGQTPITILNAVIAVHDEIVSRPRSSAVQAIINLSWSIRPDSLTFNSAPSFSGGLDIKLKLLLRKMIDSGCLIIVSAGNDKATQFDRLPARYAKASDPGRYIPELLVVGMVSADGLQRPIEGNTDFADGLPHVYAPGEGIFLPVASTWNRNDLRTWYSDREVGNSFSAGLTTGLAAYLLQRIRDGALPNVPNTVAGLRQHIIDTAWSRATVGGVDLKGIYNGAPAQANFCPWARRRHARDLFLRQEETCDKLVNGDHDKPAPPDQFKNSLDAQPYVCNKAENFKGHSDVRKDDVQETAKHFCMDHQTFMTSTSTALQGEYVVKKTKYEYEIRWLANCQLEDGKGTAQFTWQPNSDLTCQEVMTHAWQDCNNTGVGGSRVVGCLNYSFTGGRKV